MTMGEKIVLSLFQMVHGTVCTLLTQINYNSHRYGAPFLLFLTFWTQILHRFKKMALKTNLMGALVKI